MVRIVVGARKSLLSQAQAREILWEIRLHHPEIEFETVFLESHGDKDLRTSLRSLDKTDFFTREIDHLLLSGGCRIAIHSAKDLPEPIPDGLKMIALTKGVDPSDSLVMRDGVSFESLASGAIIATSSQRREEVIKQLRTDLRFIDLRGTIEQRLEKLLTREADGVIVAEAALIRLGLTRLNRLRLPGEVAVNQGKLAVLAREKDQEMANLFSVIDTLV